MDKDIQLKIKHLSEWINLHPKTNLKNIIFENGKTAEEVLTTISSDIKTLKVKKQKYIEEQKKKEEEEERRRHPIYGFIANQKTGEITYTDACKNFKPIVSDLKNHKYNMNDWKNTYILNSNNPCLMKDGKFVEYLDHNDISLTKSGRKVDYFRDSYFLDKSVMAEFKKMYYKIEHIDEDRFSFKICNKKVDSSYRCDAFMKNEYTENDNMYISSYFASSDSNYHGYRGHVLMSRPDSQYCAVINYDGNTSSGGDAELEDIDEVKKMIEFCKYEPLSFSKWLYVHMLTILVTKNLDTDKALSIPYEDSYKYDGNGQFYGQKYNGEYIVNVFHIHTWQSNKSYKTYMEGLCTNDNTILYKMTPPYNNKGYGYKSSGIDINNIKSGSISLFKSNSDFGIIPCKTRLSGYNNIGYFELNKHGYARIYGIRNIELYKYPSFDNGLANRLCK